ncbi:MAG: ABC transporter substrate-binding protein [Chthonomonadales bacterium]|nr:ABC transporter substrate-binding protein [Chthonomonadales bacterium]
MAPASRARQARALAVACAILAGAVSMAGTAPLRVRDARGVTVTLARPPARIVSLTPGNTEILFALGLGPKVVGDTAYCDWPVAARKLPKVGDVNISIEKVIALRPDLILASASASRRAIAALERVRGYRSRVFAIDPQNFTELYGAIESIGAITDRAGAARRLVSRMRAGVTAVHRAALRDATRPRVLVVVQTKPLWVVGSHNFMDDIVTLAGGINVGRGSGKGFHPFSLERVIAARPDVLLVGADSAATIRSSPAWRAVRAVRRDAVHTAGMDDFGRPSPRLVEALLAVARALHPGAFRR